jgi:hypothetical protein
MSRERAPPGDFPDVWTTIATTKQGGKMPEEIVPIRCGHQRCGDNPCPNPATLEVLGPYPDPMCEEHAREWAAAEHAERWDQPMFGGIEAYIASCEEAYEQLLAWEEQTDRANLVLSEILEEARHFLLCYEIPRARGHKERAATAGA